MRCKCRSARTVVDIGRYVSRDVEGNPRSGCTNAHESARDTHALNPSRIEPDRRGPHEMHSRGRVAREGVRRNRRTAVLGAELDRLHRSVADIHHRRGLIVPNPSRNQEIRVCRSSRKNDVSVGQSYASDHVTSAVCEDCAREGDITPENPRRRDIA